MNWLNKKIYLIFLLVIILLGGWWFYRGGKQTFLSPQGAFNFVARPLKKYSFPELKKQVFLGSEITLGETLDQTDQVTSRLFFYTVEGKRVSGLINLPNSDPPEGGWPVVILVRGFVEPEKYQTGIGSQPVGHFLAQNGFVTLSPDFLGFGSSDLPPNNVLEERFLRPVEVLELIASVKNLPQVNADKLFMWGHSNGGQIALSVLQISGADIPTVLWAPVSKPFPYSILYYTDEFDDHGKALRKVVAAFEALYDADEYSIHAYYDWINAPIQVHQGTSDDAVPLVWSQELAATLKEKGKEVTLFTYPGADHNLRNSSADPLSSWNLAVQRQLSWFASFL